MIGLSNRFKSSINLSMYPKVYMNALNSRKPVLLRFALTVEQFLNTSNHKNTNCRYRHNPKNFHQQNVTTDDCSSHLQHCPMMRELLKKN